MQTSTEHLFPEIFWFCTY